MAKSNDIIDDLISAEQTVAEIKQELEEALEIKDDLEEDFEDAINREQQTDEIISAISSDTVNDELVIDEKLEEIVEETDDKIEELKTWLANLLSPMTEQISSLFSKVETMEAKVAPSIPTPLLEDNLQMDTETNTSETKTEDSFSEPTENPDASAVENLAEVTQEIVEEIPAKLNREIHKI